MIRKWTHRHRKDAIINNVKTWIRWNLDKRTKHIVWALRANEGIKEPKFEIVDESSKPFCKETEDSIEKEQIEKIEVYNYLSKTVGNIITPFFRMSFSGGRDSIKF